LPVTTEADEAVAALFALLADSDPLLSTPVDQQVQVQVQGCARLEEMAQKLAANDYYLVTVAANDERELEDRRYKIYYVFSHPTEDLFLIIEYLLDQGSASYCSIRDHFPAVAPFEREMRDMVGLCPAANKGPPPGQLVVRRGSWLHDAYPDDLFPLRRTHTAVQLSERTAVYVPGDGPGGAASQPWVDDSADAAPDDEPAEMTIPVGPIHAGIIESGQFLITTAGEAIEDLQLRLGYTHRGIERMFQSHMDLTDGWRLAEQVSGDTSFAHSLAYCRAAEVLTDTRVPPAAELLRALFLELERIRNHVADVGGMAEDVGMEQFAAEFAVIREEVLRLNKRLTGHRYLRSVNRVGGVHVAGSLDLADIASALRERIKTFEELAASMTARSGFRERTIRVGVLSRDEALALGVTGLTARASDIPRDSRLGHPVGAYRDAGQVLLQALDLGDDEEATAGDVFARTLVRAREVLASQKLIEWLADRWPPQGVADCDRLVVEPRILPENNYTSAIGYAEGCRGDVVYWLMQDKMNGIYRCKVRDPSMLNWPALAACALPRVTTDGVRAETLVADFPLLNKSFSLSYAGNDL
jgi:Ni,Fe-hydrogenase III large subunit/Ni,Fe-hydrogenase III component G